jgi:hypothetical protein
MAALLAGVAGCGQWSASPVRDSPAPLLPLGPGVVVHVTADDVIGLPAINARARTVALAWVARAAVSGVVRVAISRDAAAAFDTPVELARLDEKGEGGRLETGVTAAGRGAAAANDPTHIWVRYTPAAGQPRAWRSRDGGRTFEVLAGAVPSGVFPEPWRVTTEDVRGVTVLPPADLRAAGSRRIARPAQAATGTVPVTVVDDHGALALAWLEHTGTATTHDIVLRRAWIDWNGGSPDATAFDAPVVVSRGEESSGAVVIASVPGGVVVAWARQANGQRTGVEARRVGLDMTCTQEQAVSSGPAQR